ncbi:MAG: hypothetical protein BWY06_02673 [Candidatus Latescibacteria bacterium ADurb.Bin168]|nr:MAG: hypothetical protein BWY06_02673 [Candidatus Latescibacteria bacterium ADurb.Bin168]
MHLSGKQRGKYTEGSGYGQLITALRHPPGCSPAGNRAAPKSDAFSFLWTVNGALEQTYGFGRGSETPSPAYAKWNCVSCRPLCLVAFIVRMAQWRCYKRMITWILAPFRVHYLP